MDENDFHGQTGNICEFALQDYDFPYSSSEEFNELHVEDGDDESGDFWLVDELTELWCNNKMIVDFVVLKLLERKISVHD